MTQRCSILNKSLTICRCHLQAQSPTLLFDSPLELRCGSRVRATYRKPGARGCIFMTFIEQGFQPCAAISYRARFVAIRDRSRGSARRHIIPNRGFERARADRFGLRCGRCRFGGAWCLHLSRLDCRDRVHEPQIRPGAAAFPTGGPRGCLSRPPATRSGIATFLGILLIVATSAGTTFDVRKTTP